MRAAAADDSVKLVPPRIMNLEQVLEFLSEDELAEVTPHFIRIRKRFLDPHQRPKKTV